jgi:hypothetical protein
MISLLVKQYFANEDTSHVKVKRSWKGDNFPAISLCLESSSTGLYNETYINTNIGISADQYKNAMLGNPGTNNLSRLQDKTFEMATFRFQNYLKKVKVKDTNGNKVEWRYNENMTDINESKPKVKSGHSLNLGNITGIRPMVLRYQDPNYICYEHHTVLPTLFTIYSIDFSFYISNLQTIKEGELYLFVYQPYQLIRTSRYLYRINGFQGINQASRTNKIVLDLNSMKIIKNRYDAHEPCDQALENDDATWIKHAIDLVGCIPPYWKSLFGGKHDRKYYVCNTTEQLKYLTSYLPGDNEIGVMKVLEMYSPPCVNMHIMANTNSDQYDEEDLLKINFRFRLVKNDFSKNRIIGLKLLTDNPINYIKI